MPASSFLLLSFQELQFALLLFLEDTYVIQTLRPPELEFQERFKTISTPTRKTAEHPTSVAPGLRGRFSLAILP